MQKLHFRFHSVSLSFLLRKGFKNNCHARSLHVKVLDFNLPLLRFERERNLGNASKYR